MRFILHWIFFLLYCLPLFAQELECEGDHNSNRLFEDFVVLNMQKSSLDYFEAEPFQMALSAECEPLITVAGCVNVLSGDFFQIEKDLIGNTIEPVSLVRYYDSGSKSESFLGYGFGSGFALWASDRQKGARHTYVMISERDGFFLPYRNKEIGSVNACWIDPRVLKKGYTNLSRAAISGHANFTNWKAVFRNAKEIEDSKWTLQLGDGTERVYSKYVKIPKEQQVRANFPTKTGYLLTKETKPNGNELHFSYRTIHGKLCLADIKTINRTKEETLHSLRFDYFSEKDSTQAGPSSDRCIISTSYGDQVEYHQEDKLRPHTTNLGIRYEKRNFLNKVSSSQNGECLYEMGDLNWKMKTIKKPRGKLIQVAYHPNGKVKALYESLEEREPVKRYEFHYHLDSTHVIDANDDLTTYHFDDQSRLSAICYYQGKLCFRQDSFQWSKKEGEEGWLKSKSIELGKKIYSLKTFRYDRRGNIICEALYGNLSGEKSQAFTTLQKKEMDRWAIHYTYFPDKRNLVKEKSTPEGCIISYDYLPETNLCTQILCHYNGKIQERTFSTYDANGQLQTLIEDDGSAKEESDLSDVTFRKIKQIQAVKEPCAAFGKPQKISEFYRNHTGHICLLKEAVISYDTKGCEIDRKVFDSQGRLSYTLTKRYDDRLRLIEESNALGHLKRYAYDDSNNKIEEECLESGKKIQYAYDLGNRLIKKTEHHNHGEVFVTSYTYNALNQLIAEKDHYEQKTTYQYDRLGNQIECIKPYMEIEGTVISPTISKEYNLLNQLISQKDEKGHSTTYCYNLYGSPTKITYPDGAKEHFLYKSCGWLKQKRNADGSSISYDYDPKGHLIQETYLDCQGLKVKEEHYQYKGPLLQSKTDSMGLVTSYEYDGAGRKIAEKIGRLKILHYTYDDFGRIICIQKQDQQELYQYDALDRVISKTLQSLQGKLYAKESYQYDSQDQKIQKVIWQSDNQTATYRSHYHSDETLQFKENPLYQVEKWQYHHRLAAKTGGYIQSRTLFDALGRPQIEIDDAFHRLVKKEILEDKTQRACTHFQYDAKGNCVKEHAFILADGNFLREYWVERQYNRRGWLASETEMPQGKKNRYQYDLMGRLSQKQKPDGVILSYTYDALGRLQTQTSSDQTISYTYTYDLHDHLIQIEDTIHQNVQKRSFDLYNRLEKEEISPGVILHYAYDSLDRLTKMTLPDGSFVALTYDAFHLMQAERFNSAHQQLYQITLPRYDLRGNLLEMRSPAGRVHYAYDLLSRPITIRSSHWESHLEQFDPLGNLLKIKQKDPSGTLHEQFAYDRFNHLTQESGQIDNQYAYDSIGNCLRKNQSLYTVNALNQLTDSQEVQYSYDPNGNLQTQSKPFVSYTYDALNRLISCEKDKERTTFLYDAFDRCIQITDSSGTRQLLYQGTQEIGSLAHGRIQEFRLIHPDDRYDLTLAIELKDEAFFPIQDFRGNICALQTKNGKLAQWMRYSAFGLRSIAGDVENISNPWRFAGKREVASLSLFAHRFYNPLLMRWQTTDPLGFKDGLNLYAYVHNRPFYYKDPDGQFAFAIPLVIGAFGTGGIVLTGPTIGAIAGITVGTALGFVVTKAIHWADHKFDNVRADTDEEDVEVSSQFKDRKKEKINDRKYKFPENPDELLPELPRDEKGHIYPADNIRIRPEKHEIKPGETYNTRHHGQHYHVETRRDPAQTWNKKSNIKKLEPKSYYLGEGTGFLPGENFPGMI